MTLASLAATDADYESPQRNKPTQRYDKRKGCRHMAPTASALVSRLFLN